MKRVLRVAEACQCHFNDQVNPQQFETLVQYLEVITPYWAIINIIVKYGVALSTHLRFKSF